MRWSVLTGLLLVLVALSGCTDGGDENPGSTSTTSTTSSSATSTAPPTDRERTEVRFEMTGEYNPSFVPFLIPDGDFEYGESFTVPQGHLLVVTFANEDESGSSHDFCIQVGDSESGSDPCTRTIGAGSEAVLEFVVDLAPGTYEIYCSVGQHRQNGMENTFEVRAE